MEKEESELPYLTITALEDDFQISFSNRCNAQYSLNGTDWTEYDDSTSPIINAGEKIYFKGNLNGIDTCGMFYTEQRFNLSGNCMSLIFGDEAECKTILNYERCFSYLFQDCTGLEQVSKNFLPATTLTEDCYSGMFNGCTSLVTAPELPATELASNCYSVMFQDCTSLVTAPELPATTLAENCYQSMFNGCTSLNYIKMLATDISTRNCLSVWVIDVSPTGTFVKSKDATWNVTGINGIPEGWTVETA